MKHRRRISQELESEIRRTWPLAASQYRREMARSARLEAQGEPSLARSVRYVAEHIGAQVGLPISPTGPKIPLRRQ